ncbi:BCL2/adenovirus E1B 19 kDa protein-interacting protein 3-like, partial [Oxyura jamaicensis]|uniref:BCL2/adenovirus E1B 19 kDa protein-interacting protein 3-like n=1 Tax=Oxyura jamaicensis TaxID=8884 RepID=UPI0015A50DC0
RLPAGSWVQLRGGLGGADPAPSSCHADVERLLLEAQLEPDGADGALPVPSPPARGEEGAGQASERPARSERPPPRGRAPPGRPQPLPGREPAACTQRDAPEDAERTGQRLPAALGRGCARCPEHLPAKDFAFVCSPQPVLWSLPGGAVGRKKRLFSSELLLLFIPSLLLSHVLTLGLGIYIGKRLAASSANPL